MLPETILSSDAIEKLKELLGNLKITGIKLDMYSIYVRRMLNKGAKG